MNLKKQLLILLLLAAGSVSFAKSELIINHNYLVDGVQFSSDGQKLLAWTNDDPNDYNQAIFSLYDVVSGKQLMSRKIQTNSSHETSFCGGDKFVCIGKSYSSSVVEIATGKEYMLNTPQITKTGNFLIGNHDDDTYDTLRLINLKDGSHSKIDVSNWNYQEFSSSETHLFLSSDYRAKTIDLVTGQEKEFEIQSPVLTTHNSAIGGFATDELYFIIEIIFSTGETKIIYSAPEPIEYKYFIETNTIMVLVPDYPNYKDQKISLIDLNTGSITGYSFIFGSRYFLSPNIILSFDKNQLFNIRKEENYSFSITTSDNNISATMTTDENRAVIRYEDIVSILDTGSGKILNSYKYNSSRIDAKNGLLIIEDGQNPEFHVIDINSAAIIKKSFFEGAPLEFKISPDGRWAISSYEDYQNGTTIKKSEVMGLDSNFSYFSNKTSAEFSPNGSMIALFDTAEEDIKILRLP